MADPHRMTDWDKLRQMLDKADLGRKQTTIDEAAFAAALKSRIRGQDEIIDDLAKLVRLSLLKERRSGPVCNLLFLGPTGTGKTELAKAMAENLFDGDSSLLRFDCSELSSPEMGKSRLVGASLGYRGAESGGQLTRPMFANPKRLVLFDEIEKADGEVFDLFLQLMGEGRLTEQGSGKVADFTQSVVVLTSNAQAEAIGKIQREVKDYFELVNAIKSYLADAHVFRPEILGRIDKVYVFKPLEGMVIAEIALLKIEKLGKDFGLGVSFVAPELVMQALESNVKVSKFGIRELERIVFDLFAKQMVDARAKGAAAVSFGVDASGAIDCRLTMPDPPAPSRGS